MQMHLSEIQRHKREFEAERGWTGFSASQVFAHLIEEIGEVGRHILYSEGYKKAGLGHREAPREIEREFAQCLSLLVQLANREGVDLEKAYLKELTIMQRRFPAAAWRNYTKSLGLPGIRSNRKRK